MLSFKSIQSYYPDKLKTFKRNILREFLQYKILDIVFSSQYANKLSFLGGTALRIVHDNNRFSEDLDFDNFALSEADFGVLIGDIVKSLEKEGLTVETRDVFKGAYRCYFK